MPSVMGRADGHRAPDLRLAGKASSSAPAGAGPVPGAGTAAGMALK
jgi:hypothetical protein